jgi:GT2 family glycosyltransferase
MSVDKRLLAVCVNWNGEHVLEETLRSLLKSTYPNLEVRVVDNASEDQSWKLVSPEIQLIRLKENRGYAQALNRALEPSLHSGSAPEYFLLLNNDLTFAPETISRLVTFAEEKGPGVYGPKVLLWDEPDRLDAAWGRISWTHVLASFKGIGEPDSALWTTRQVELLLGCALLVHRDVFEKVGFLDSRYFMYHEEVDFLYRVSQAGFPVWFFSPAVIRHHSGHGTRETPLKKVYWIRRNTVLFFRKFRPGLGRWTKFSATLLASLVFNSLLLRWRQVGTILKGVLDGFREDLSDG